jgi:two-component system chemotaxis response regulator CheY
MAVKKILVVDDSPSIRNVLKSTLQGGGFEVATAQDGQKAIKMVNSESFDLIITDVNMPNMNGIEFTDSVRKGENPNKHVPILVSTTESAREKKDSGRVAGASGWIVKPFEGTTLLAAVNKLLSR